MLNCLFDEWREMTTDGAATVKPDDQHLKPLLDALNAGKPGALEELTSAIYPELKRLAHFQLLRERHNHTLNTTAIVHEAFLRLAGSAADYNDAKHFFRAAARVMRHLLVDHARQRNSNKRGSGKAPLTLDVEQHGEEDDLHAVLAMDSALIELARIDQRLVEIVECRCFAGLTVAETAQALDMSVRSVERAWRRARGYLGTALHDAK